MPHKNTVHTGMLAYLCDGQRMHTTVSDLYEVLTQAIPVVREDFRLTHAGFPTSTAVPCPYETYRGQ